MSARPETLLKRRIKAILKAWEDAGREVGGLVVEGDRVTILSPEAASSELDEFERWERQQAQGDAA